MSDTIEAATGGSEGDDGKAEKPKSLLWRIWGWWQWVSRARWLNWLISLFSGKAGIAAGAAGIAVAGAGAYAVMEPAVVRDAFAPKRTVVTERWDESTVVFPITGRDKAGRSASFDVAVMSRATTWARGSADTLEHGGEIVGAGAIPAMVLTPEIRRGLDRSETWIAVGVASEEGQAETEIERARRRAGVAATWMAAISEGERKVLRLNLGQSRSGCEAAAASASTSFQRPFMMIGIRSRETGVVVVEALAGAMSGKSNLPSPECYSRFALD